MASTKKYNIAGTSVDMNGVLSWRFANGVDPTHRTAVLKYNGHTKISFIMGEPKTKEEWVKHLQRLGWIGSMPLGKRQVTRPAEHMQLRYMAPSMMPAVEAWNEINVKGIQLPAIIY